MEVGLSYEEVEGHQDDLWGGIFPSFVVWGPPIVSFGRCGCGQERENKNK